jgi:hypothetical protein
VIRRGFWLVVGAAGGIAGYRRVSSLGRQVSQTLGTGQKTAGSGQKSTGARKRHWVRESLRFRRDVRQGMDLYFDRHQARSAPTLGPGARALTSNDRDQREDH